MLLKNLIVKLSKAKSYFTLTISLRLHFNEVVHIKHDLFYL